MSDPVVKVNVNFPEYITASGVFRFLEIMYALEEKASHSQGDEAWEPAGTHSMDEPQKKNGQKAA